MAQNKDVLYEQYIFIYRGTFDVCVCVCMCVCLSTPNSKQRIVIGFFSCEVASQPLTSEVFRAAFVLCTLLSVATMMLSYK